MRNKGTSECDSISRKRGRPAGKNRVPLTLEERRARNTQYERERRNETSKAMAELAEAAGCQSSISAPDLLATVISQIQSGAKRKSTDDIEDLKRINTNLMSQISKLERQLMNHCPDIDLNSANDIDINYESESEQQPLESFNSGSNGDTRPPHRKKPVIKRKRKNQSEDSDSQECGDFSADDDEDVNLKKRRKTQLARIKEIAPRRETRNYSTSQSSYETQSSQPDHMGHGMNTMYQSEINEQTDLMREMLQPGYSENILVTTHSIEANMPAEPRLSSILDSPNWLTDYYTANPIDEPEYIPEQNFNSTITPSNHELVISNEIPEEQQLLPIGSIDFPEADLSFINEFDWFNGIIPNPISVENDGNNLIYS